MFKRIISVLLSIVLVLSMGVCLCSCDESESDNFPVTINNVTIEDEPENIVVLSNKLADIISFIGYDVRMVGKSAECDHEYFKRVPEVGSQASPDADAIISLETDLVFTDTALDKTVAQKLKDADIDVLTISNAKKFSEMKPLYEKLGMAIGGKVTGKAEGQKGYDNLMKTLKDFENAVPNDIITSACYLYLNENNELCTFTKGSLEFDVFSYCGAKNTFVTQAKPEVDLEQLKVGTPSYIFYDNEAVVEKLKADAELSTMSAVTNENMMLIDKTQFTYLGITFHDTIYKMMDFMFIKDEATPDEATPDEATQPATTAATKAQTSATQAPSEEQLDSFTIE